MEKQKEVKYVVSAFSKETGRTEFFYVSVENPKKAKEFLNYDKDLQDFKVYERVL